MFAEQKANAHLNVAAANRFIAAALGGEDGSAVTKESEKHAEGDTAANSADAKETPGSNKKKKSKKTSSTPETKSSDQGSKETKSKKKRKLVEGESTPGTSKLKKKKAA